MLMMAGGVLLSASRFWIAIKPPNVTTPRQDASTIFALGAAALAYSASRIASVSSPFAPGSVQLLPPPTGAGWTCVNVAPANDERPNTERKEVQSAVVKTSVSSITTIVWPCPEIPAVKSGFRLQIV